MLVTVATWTLFLYSAILFAVLVAMVALSIGFYRRAKRYAKLQEMLTKRLEKRLQNKYNRIATLEPKDLGAFLTKAYAQSLELAAIANTSENDPDAQEVLSVAALATLRKYLGEDTVEAIDYYYGSDYLGRWTMQVFRLLENRGVLPTIIKQELTAEGIMSRLK